MKVTHVYRYSYPPLHGGIEQSIHSLVQQHKASIRPEVLVSGERPGMIDDEGVPIRSAGSLGHVIGAPISPSMPYWLRRSGADLLHFHMPNPTGELSYLLAASSIPSVATYHMETVRYAGALKFYKPFLDAFLKRVSRIIVSTPQHIETSAFLPAYRDKCRIVPFGVDPKRFEATAEVRWKAAEMRRKYGNRLALFIGKLRHYKGLDYLLKAMTQVDGRALILGEGEEKERLKALAEELQLGDRVVWLPHMESSDFIATLHACDVFVLPSIYRTETFGIAQLEAQACGKPSICTALGTGVEHVTLHGRTGLVVPPKDADALAEALRKLLDDAEYRNSLGEAALRRVHEEFTLEKTSAAVLNVYREALSGVPSGARAMAA